MKQLGDILDGLGVVAEINDGDLVASAVVVMAVLTNDDNVPRLTIASNEGLSWIEQAGLMRLAERLCSETPEHDE